MPHPQNRLPRNSILRQLPPADLAVVQPYLRPVVLKARNVLQDPRGRVEHVHFIETGVVSLRTLAAGCTFETAMVGSQGAVGVSVALGTDTPVHQSIVLVPGTAMRIHVEDMKSVMRDRPLIREHMLRYVQALLIHSSHTALCCVRHNIDERLSSWLCLACDAFEGDVLPITHDHISVMLGLRRAGVTEALLRFERLGLVRKMRGVLEIRDRELLRQRACSCYMSIAKAYRSIQSIKSALELIS